jgi:hypothetical protein
MASEEAADYRIEGGYIQIIKFLEERLKNENCDITLNTPVTELNWKAGNVIVRSGYKSFNADRF